MYNLATTPRHAHLDVAVDDPLRVAVLERQGQLNKAPHRAALGRRPPRAPPPARPPLQVAARAELHHQRGAAVRGGKRADVLDHVRVAQPGQDRDLLGGEAARPAARAAEVEDLDADVGAVGAAARRERAAKGAAPELAHDLKLLGAAGAMRVGGAGGGAAGAAARGGALAGAAAALLLVLLVDRRRGVGVICVGGDFVGEQAPGRHGAEGARGRAPDGRRRRRRFRPYGRHRHGHRAFRPAFCRELGLGPRPARGRLAARRRGRWRAAAGAAGAEARAQPPLRPGPAHRGVGFS